MSYNPETGEYVRICKQCEEKMENPLKVSDKLYMFCSAACKTAWDHERAYKTKDLSDANFN